jgi:excisionase family DNA binding protein
MNRDEMRPLRRMSVKKRRTKPTSDERLVGRSQRVTLDALPPFLDVAEYAAVHRISPGLVYSMIKRGTVAAIRCGRLIRIPRSSVAG